ATCGNCSLTITNFIFDQCQHFTSSQLNTTEIDSLEFSYILQTPSTPCLAEYLPRDSIFTVQYVKPICEVYDNIFQLSKVGTLEPSSVGECLPGTDGYNFFQIIPANNQSSSYNLNL